jgi:hypothetical protein
MPEREAKEWKLQTEIDCISGATTLDLSKIRWLNEEVDAEPPG